MKVDATVKKETLFILFITALLSVIMQSVFLILGKWDYTVLTGNILGGGAGVLNFFFMGLGIQKAVLKEEKAAKDMLKLSQTVRMLGIAAVVIICITVPVFSALSAVIGLVFPRIGVALRPYIKK